MQCNYFICQKCRPGRYYYDFGLYEKDQAYVCRLQSLDKELQIHNQLARLTYKQLYYNPNKCPIQTEYIFPYKAIGEFVNFKAEFPNKTYESEIQVEEKKEND
jgi:hypothetical protein